MKYPIDDLLDTLPKDVVSSNIVQTIRTRWDAFAASLQDAANTCDESKKETERFQRIAVDLVETVKACRAEIRRLRAVIDELKLA